jgi:hypothetical protein
MIQEDNDKDIDYSDNPELDDSFFEKEIIELPNINKKPKTQSEFL